MWQRSISKLAAAAALALVLVWGLPARSATFSVDPIIVTLEKGNTSATVAIKNQSPDLLRLQVTGFAWQQSPSGEMQLTPTDDLVFFPQLLTLGPGETHRVRIGTTAEQGPVEKTFRMFVEELPSLQSVITPKAAGITLRLKIGIPVFVSPNVRASVSGAIRDASIRNNVLAFDVVNTGNTHFSIQQVHVVGKNASGADVLTRELTGWYLLAGGTRHFTVSISKSNCESLSSLAVQVHADATTLSTSFPNLSKQCGFVSRL
ncbi:MAG TPA: fimbria/pilus periplasmic chaperone [Candidatus Baltobacteraceae bacterium]|jgi:fimbrial chaperone protein